jgi:hypothetical protein
MNINEMEFSGKYYAGIHRVGLADTKIIEAFKQLKYDLDNLYAAFAKNAIEENEYCGYKVKSIEFFNENLNKAIHEFQVG